MRGCWTEKFGLLVFTPSLEFSRLPVMLSPLKTTLFPVPNAQAADWRVHSSFISLETKILTSKSKIRLELHFDPSGSIWTVNIWRYKASLLACRCKKTEVNLCLCFTTTGQEHRNNYSVIKHNVKLLMFTFLIFPSTNSALISHNWDFFSLPLAK